VGGDEGGESEVGEVDKSNMGPGGDCSEEVGCSEWNYLLGVGQYKVSVFSNEIAHCC
jgi:hypothetical protein